uniref:Uncharacterized protein n=1 Tax=Fagus sylvatica TaxID=28930 RepID=A0A2N9IG34_FAGSY
MQDALLPSMKALISIELLRHSEMDVKVSVASCITEITRITAPDAPYDDDQMKEIFQLTVAAFEKLSHVSSRCYTKAVSILDTVAKDCKKYPAAELSLFSEILEGELSWLGICTLKSVEIVVCFRTGFRILESFINSPDCLFKELNPLPGRKNLSFLIEGMKELIAFNRHSAEGLSPLTMETIMTVVIDESEEISLELLSPLLASVRKEHQNVSPISWKLGEKVISNCAVKLKPYLKEAVRSMGIALDDYAQIVTSVCQSESDHLKHEHVNGSREHLADESKLGKRTVSNEPPRRDPNEPSLVTMGVASDTVCPTKVGQAVDGASKSAVSNGTPTRNDDGLKNINSSKRLQSCRFTKHSKSIGARSYAEPENLDSMKAVKSELEPDSGLKKRGRKPNSLMNPEEGYDHSWIGTGRKTSKTLDHKATFPSMLEKIIAFLMSSHPKRGRPKKKGNNVNQDADPNSLAMSKGGFLNAEVEEKALQSADVSLKKESEVTSNSDAKPQRRSRKIGMSVKTNEETTQTPGRIVSEKEATTPSGTEEKLLQPSDINVGITNINNRLSIQTDSKKRKRKYASSEKDITEASNRGRVPQWRYESE